MKKLKLFIFIFFLFISSTLIAKANSLNSIDIKGNLDKNGTLHLEEIWQMRTNKDTEIYKEEYNLGNMIIQNFKVRDEKREYTKVNNWDINGSFNDKKYKYGINYTNNGPELCWGISEYGNKTYTISYDIVNAVFSTEDADVLYLRLINDLNFPPKRFNIQISGFESFLDTLDVWGYGYKGYAYVDSGKIFMSNEENTSLKKGDYGVLLVKFPKGTFNINQDNTYNKYQTFNDVYKMAEKGTFDYNYNNKNTFLDIIVIIISFLSQFAIFFFIFLGVFKSKQKYKFGKLGKKIDIFKVNHFRDIPCDKDIYKAYFIANAYNLNKKNTDFFGTILLKWLNENKITIKKITKDKLIGTKEETCLDLNNFQSDLEIENKLFNMMYDASKDGILEEKEFEKYSKKNYKKIFKWFDQVEEYGRDLYISLNLVTKDKSKYLIHDELKEEAIKLAGLKKYLQDFSMIDTKQPMEVKLWKEYLMYAQIFGIANYVAKQFKKLYPEVLVEMQAYNYDIGDIILLNSFCHTAVVSASSARSAASSYSSGGGGFSSGGGGGGSFGGGGGGSR